MATKAHLEGNKRYLDKQDNIMIRVPKGRKAEIQQHAQNKGKSLNKYIVDLIYADAGSNKRLKIPLGDGDNLLINEYCSRYEIKIETHDGEIIDVVDIEVEHNEVNEDKHDISVFCSGKKYVDYFTPFHWRW